jgi:hypothetical protein
MNEMDENLKGLMKELGNAINESLSTSEAIQETISRIKASGYNVFLVLEATIGFNKRSKESHVDSSSTPNNNYEAKLNITSQDVKFLKSLKISVEESEFNS